MAVTIHSTPNTFTPSGNPLTWIFSSDETAQANFSYVVEVSVDGSLIETHELFPEVGAKAHFDCSDVAERYCRTIPPNTSLSQFDAGNFIDLKCEIFEKYGTPAAIALSASSTIVTYKGKLSKSNFLSLLPSSYIFGASKLWLTLFPRTEKRYVNLSYPNFFTYLTNEQTLQLKLIMYDVDDNITFSTSIAVAATTNVTTYYIDNAILLGYGAIQSEIDDTSYMTIQVQTSGGAIVSEIMTLYVDDRDYSTSAKHLVFLSSIGSLEGYTFIKRSKDKLSTKGEPFEGVFGRFDEDGDFSYQLGGTVDFVKTIENKLDIQTDWLSETEQQWLIRELLTSPLVYLYEGGNLIPVRITNNEGEYKTSENDMVFSEKFTIHKYNDISTVV